MTYPPEPWRLRGQAYVTAWRLPASRLPAVPAGITPVTALGSGFVITAWVDYQPGGVLAYRELMATVAVRHGFGVAATITHIWVDSPVSRDGGRALWHIPKDLAEFELTHSPAVASARTAAGPIAEATFRPIAGLPVALPTAFSVLQDGPLRSPVRVRGTPVAAASAWRFDQDGPLGFLTGASALASLVVRDVDLTFGTARG